MVPALEAPIGSGCREIAWPSASMDEDVAVGAAY